MWIPLDSKACFVFEWVACESALRREATSLRPKAQCL